MFEPTTFPKSAAAAAAAIQCLLLVWQPCTAVFLCRLLKYVLTNLFLILKLFYFFHLQMHCASARLTRFQPIPPNVFPSFLSHVVITRHACRSFAAAVSCDDEMTAIPSSSSSNTIQNTNSNACTLSGPSIDVPLSLRSCFVICSVTHH
jgi:hypothetical protein